MTPTQRSLALLRAEGWHCEVVERFNPHTKTRHDLFGIADLIAIKPGEKPRLVQTTSGSNAAARVSKITALDLTPHVLASGFAIEVHGWRRLLVKRGGKAKRWTPVRILYGEQECLPQPCAMSP